MSFSARVRSRNLSQFESIFLASASSSFDAITAKPIDAKVCSEPCAPLFAFGDGNDFWLGESEKYRFIVVDDVEGETVTIFFGGPAVEFEELLPTAQKVLNTVEWGGA